MADKLSFALLGSPVSHSLSSVMFRAAFAALDLPHRYELVDVPDHAALERELASIRSGAREGANVTLPHKRAALQLADVARRSASDTGAANLLARAVMKDGVHVVAHNTDADALKGRIARRCAERPIRAAIVLGAGGGALAAVAALRALGAEQVLVTSRSFGAEPERDARSASLALGGATLVPWHETALLPAAEVDVVVQATSAGVSAAAPQTTTLLDVVPWAELPRTAFAIDLVYGPNETPFCERATREGLDAESGLGMLVAQAEASFELWLGEPAPPGVMQSAAEVALAERRRA